MSNRFVITLTLALCGHAPPVAAGPYDPPPAYYESATGVGATLRVQLHDIVDDHTVLSYNSARANLQVTDEDPSNSDNIILVYNRVSLDVSDLISSPGIPGWDSGVSWNREHTWPRSRGVNSSGADNTDLHQLRPATPGVNSSRSNLNFGGGFGQQFGRVTDNGQTVWYPGDADAGMIARQQFYMDVRYDGTDSSTEDLSLLSGNPSQTGPNLGDLDRMIEWHFQAPPDEFELRRNDIIFDQFQGNRNPFVDRPEFVWSVFVDQQNDSQISIDGSSVDPSGASTATVDLGSVLVDGPLPASQTITANKLGNDGTYFEVQTSGGATSDLTGRFNAFTTGGSDSVSLDVGLDASTEVAGSLSGVVTIDNLDVTDGGGAGRGANDANDEVTVMFDVLDHATPSFASAASQESLSFDFGSVAAGAAASPFSFEIFNVENSVDFTAALDLDSIVGSGDTSILSTDLSEFSELQAGQNNGFTADFDTSVVGGFSATYLLSFSDQDLPGEAALGNLTLMLTGEVFAIGNADFDSDADVDGWDFLTWQEGVGTGTQFSDGDANGTGTVDAADLAILEQQFGAPQSQQLVSVPEPQVVYLLLAAAVSLVAPARRKSRQ